MLQLGGAQTRQQTLARMLVASAPTELRGQER